MNWGYSDGVYVTAPDDKVHYMICYDKDSSMYAVEVDKIDADGYWHMTERQEFTSLADAKHWCETHYAVAV